MAQNFFMPARGDVSLVPIWPHAGAPSDGTAGTIAGVASPGDFLYDTTGSALYVNDGTSDSPTWTAFAAAAGAVAITGGSINGTTVGETTPAAADFTFARESYAGGLTAVGTSRTNALALTAATNRVTVAASSAVGVILPPSATVGVGGVVTVINDGPLNSFHVYAAGSDTIDGTGGSTGVALTNAFQCAYQVDAAGAFISYRLAVTRSA